MILFFYLGCKLSIHTLGIFIGPREVGQKIGQTHTQTNTLTYANFNIDKWGFGDSQLNNTVIPKVLLVDSLASNNNAWVQQRKQ